MDILSQEFEELREQFRNKMDEVCETIEEMKQKYNDCENFSNNILKPNQWRIDENLKNEGERLLKEYENSIERWQSADKDFNDFCKKHPGLT